MASYALIRRLLVLVGMFAALTNPIMPATAEPFPRRPQRISDSIAHQFTMTVPLKQCEYPRFWSHERENSRTTRRVAMTGDLASSETRFARIAENSSVGGAPRGARPDHTPLDIAREMADRAVCPEGACGLWNSVSVPPVGELRTAHGVDPLRSLAPRAPSERTSAIFQSITTYFHNEGYETPETLSIVAAKAPNAFVRNRREVVLTEALVNHVKDPSELAFILAHEVAHVALGHHVQGGISAEVAADSLALNIVTALGFNPCSGSSVLERLGAPAKVSLVSLTPRLHALHNRTSSFCG